MRNSLILIQIAQQIAVIGVSETKMLIAEHTPMDVKYKLECTV